MFTRDDLRVGQVVKFRNGDYGLVVPRSVNAFTGMDCAPDQTPVVRKLCMSVVVEKTDFFTHTTSYLSRGDVDKYDASLHRPNFPQWDIEEVYGWAFEAWNALKLTEEAVHKRPLLWKRPAEKITMTELAKRLGYEVVIVEEETE